MNVRQIGAADGSWYLIADWQGVTRIAFPGDKVKTDAGLDCPNESGPLVIAPNGSVWLEGSTSVEPVSLKKERSAYGTPDPLGGPALAVFSSSVKVRDEELTLSVSGDPLPLGGSARRRAPWAPTSFVVFADQTSE